MKRNPALIYLFEFTNITGCIVVPCCLYFNIGGWFYPPEGAADLEAILSCVQATLLASAFFALYIGIPLLLLLVDCFVIMRGVKGFQVSALSVLTMPASYPILRTEILQERPTVRRFHVIAGGVIFASNALVVSAYVQYGIRLTIRLCNL